MIECIKSYLPDQVLSNECLSKEYKDWNAKKIYEKTGIKERRIAGKDECASDLGEKAAQKLFEHHDPQSVDFLLFCTQSPDYLLPTTACLLQNRLGIKKASGALDFNLGCSGYIYGLAMGQSLLKSDLAQRVLLITADTYSKYIAPQDKSTRTLFGDAGTATLLSPKSSTHLHSFVLGTDGEGFEKFIIPGGGARHPTIKHKTLEMEGHEMFNFTLKVIPKLVEDILNKANLKDKDIDCYIFHQANAFMIEHLRKRLGIPLERFVYHLESVGNTVSSSIPLALEKSLESGKVTSKMKVMLVGFGVGLSWGGCILEWDSN